MNLLNIWYDNQIHSCLKLNSKMRNENDFSICSTVSQVKKQLKNINAIERCHCHSMSFFQCHSILCEYHRWQGKGVIAIWKVLLYKIKTQPFTVVFYQISVLKIFSKLTEKHLLRSHFSMTFQVLQLY